jgi:uncharacterized DUF497 family protein
VKIVWDERKRAANLDKHGMDFANVGAFDWDRAVILAGKVDRFGKRRLKAVGHYEGRIAVVIFAMLGSEAVSIISFRPAKAKEKKVLE